MKQCTKCKKWKDESHFRKHSQVKCGLRPECKDCSKKVNANIYWNKGGREKRIARSLEKYGLTLEQYNKMLEQQNGVCLICGQTSKRGHRLCVDHNHKTGKIRGLLCDPCNQWVGVIEKKGFLKQALIYLEKYE